MKVTLSKKGKTKITLKYFMKLRKTLSEGDEEEEDSIVNQVLDEIGIEISGKVREKACYQHHNMSTFIETRVFHVLTYMETRVLQVSTSIEPRVFSGRGRSICPYRCNRLENQDESQRRGQRNRGHVGPTQGLIDNRTQSFTNSMSKKSFHGEEKDFSVRGLTRLQILM